jgi:type I restriction enzyme S subunit
MIADLQPYPSMKESGVRWIGLVPEHWDVMRVQRIGRLFKGNGGSKEDEVSAGVPCVRYGDLYTWHEFFIRNTRAHVAPDRSRSYTQIRYGDVLFAASGETLEDIGRSAVNLIEGEVRCGGDILVLRPRIAVVPSYLGYAADSTPAKHQKALMGRGFTVVHIYASQLRQLMLPIPPVAEQTSIALFLNHANKLIRRHIQAKKKLIALLNEQKQSIIHQAVTRGLDPNVRLKPSGAEWLGDVPEYWKMRRAKYLFREVDERSTSGKELLLSLRMYRGLVPHHEVSDAPISSDALIGYKKVVPGQIVMNRMRAALGMFGLANQEGLVSPDYAIFEPVEGLEPQFYLHLFKTPVARGAFRVESKGLGTGSAGFMRLYTDRFGSIKLPVPPRREQLEIVRDIHRQAQNIEVGEARIRREVDLLHEYRARLMVEVVTGKLDVRKAVANLPIEHEEALELDEVETQDEDDVETGYDLGEEIEVEA